MIEFINVDKKTEEEMSEQFNIYEDSDLFVLRLDGKTIGCGQIDVKSKDNKISLFIIEKYRGNGYGKQLFKNLLKEYKKLGNKDVEIIVSKDNIRMNKIIVDNNGVIIDQQENTIRYIVPIK